MYWLDQWTWFHPWRDLTPLSTDAERGNSSYFSFQILEGEFGLVADEGALFFEGGFDFIAEAFHGRVAFVFVDGIEAFEGAFQDFNRLFVVFVNAVGGGDVVEDDGIIALDAFEEGLGGEEGEFAVAIFFGGLLDGEKGESGLVFKVFGGKGFDLLFCSGNVIGGKDANFYQRSFAGDGGFSEFIELGHGFGFFALFVEFLGGGDFFVEPLHFEGFGDFFLSFLAGFGDIELFSDDLVEGLIDSAGVADPGNFAGLIDDKSGGNSLADAGFHPFGGHVHLFAIDCDAVGHFVAHFFEEILDALVLSGLVIPDVDANELGFALEFFAEVVKVGNNVNARSAPSRPEFDDVDFSGLECFDFGALVVFGDFEGGGFVAREEGLGVGLGGGDGGEGQEREEEYHGVLSKDTIPGRLRIVRMLGDGHFDIGFGVGAAAAAGFERA